MSQSNPSGPISFPKLTQDKPCGVAPIGIFLGKEETQPQGVLSRAGGWRQPPTPCLPPRSDSGTPSLGQGSARSSARPGRSGRLWKRSSQAWGTPRARPRLRFPSRRRCSTSRARSSPRAGYGRAPAPLPAGRGAPAPAPPAAALPERSGLFLLQGKARAPGRRGILAALLRRLRGLPRLRPQLRGEQELALAMAQCALDDSEWVHMRILQTIYRQLTRSRLGCPRYGAHWEELGFQGADPGTDLRGTGMLGLMQILFFVLDSRTLPLAREIFQLSQHETQNFPFCIMSVNITRIVIQALQEERLSRECNRRQQVIGVLNDLYAAAFLRLSRLWEQQHGTVANAGFFLKELELSTKKKPRQLLKSLEAYLSRGLRPPSPPSSQVHFTSICDPGVELEGDS
ncbi:ELMO domain-containing protein 3 isoform X1 [Haemorhous mexicanus]|uniref:ELMO domain-containing protein 3 isoform X1 n=2 Tax=Haemorhous mexicanus TaxID=30427 RepID=UPI0028BE9247|nr:ELMO domain-containing protein 3 isoform X1 [Haemorhous mexicanus]